MTDLCVFEPDATTKELTVVSLHPGVTREQVAEATGWPVKFAANLAETPPPTDIELKELRAIQARTAAAHGAAA
jgi:glutaconate CoA-transferase subunit B